MEKQKNIKRVCNPEQDNSYNTLYDLSNNKYGIRMSLINDHMDKDRLKFTASMYINKSYLLEIDLYKRKLENINNNNNNNNNNNQPNDISNNISNDNSYYILPGESFLSKEIIKIPFRFRLPIKIESVYTNYKLVSRTVDKKNIHVFHNGIVLNKNNKLPEYNFDIANIGLDKSQKGYINLSGLSDVFDSTGAKKISNNLTNKKEKVRIFSSRDADGNLLKDNINIHISMNVLPFSKISDFYTEALEFRKAVMSFITKTLYDIKFETKLDIEKSKVWYSFMKLRDGEIKDIIEKEKKPISFI